MTFAFAGRKGLGGASMRGEAVAKHLGVPFFDLKEFPLPKKYDCIVLVKYWDRKGSVIRKSCKRLIFDPLDCWSSTKPTSEVSAFWKWCQKELHFDEIIATSPACSDTMQELEVPIHILPHHHDPRISLTWYSISGPIVYSGGAQFINRELPAIKKACKQLNREFIIQSGRGCWKALQGAALCLHPRLPPEDTELNRLCKPQVKLANARAAGIPILATRHPCIESLKPEKITWIEDFKTWPERLTAGLIAPPLINTQYALNKYATQISNHCLRIRL